MRLVWRKSANEIIEDDAASSSKVDQKDDKASTSDMVYKDNKASYSDVVKQDVYRRNKLSRYLS